MTDSPAGPGAPESAPSLWPRFTPEERKLFWLFAAVALLARGAALFSLGYQTDDYAHLANGPFTFHATLWWLGDGRFFARFAAVSLEEIGLAMPLGHGVYFVFASLALVWAGVILCRLWGVTRDRAVSAWVVGSIALHPYLGELFAYRICYLPLALMFGLGFLGLWWMRAGGVAWWLGVSCAIAALGTYQAILHYMLVAAGVGAVLAVLRSDRRQPGWLKGALADSALPRLLAGIVASALLYLAVANAVRSLAGVPPSGRMGFLPPDEVVTRLRNVWHFLQWMALRDELVPRGTRLLLLGLLAFGLASAWRLCGTPARASRALPGLLAILLLTGAAIGSIALSLVGVSWSGIPRVAAAVGLWWAGIGCLALLQRGPLRTAALAMSGIVLVSYACIDHRLLVEQQRLNRRDFAFANRIVSRLEALPGFPQVTRLAVVGGRMDYPDRLAFRHGEITASAFGRPWSQRAVLLETSGYAFGAPTAADLALAERLRAQAPTWPAEGSVQIVGSLALVFLSPES